MLKSDMRALESAIASTLRIGKKQARAIMTRGINHERLIYTAGHDMRDCIIVPKPHDDYVVVFPKCHDGRHRMLLTLILDPSDLDAWNALPSEDRAVPACIPAH